MTLITWYVELTCFFVLCWCFCATCGPFENIKVKHKNLKVQYPKCPLGAGCCNIGTHQARKTIFTAKLNIFWETVWLISASGQFFTTYQDQIILSVPISRFGLQQDDDDDTHFDI